MGCQGGWSRDGGLREGGFSRAAAGKSMPWTMRCGKKGHEESLPPVGKEGPWGFIASWTPHLWRTANQLGSSKSWTQQLNSKFTAQMLLPVIVYVCTFLQRNHWQGHKWLMILVKRYFNVDWSRKDVNFKYLYFLLTIGGFQEHGT